MNKKVAILMLSLSFLTLSVPNLVFGQGVGNFQDALKISNDTVKKSGMKAEGSVEGYVATLTSIALSIIGVIFFVLMFYGGYLWMTARGDSKIAEKAKDIIIMAVIGLVIVVLAYAISKFVIDALVGAAVKTG
ncbi:MAG TPA: hypothetical protein PKY08_01440 [Candidatus Magasanikbacteria bacterium]|nr:hypothetical protein [Candidatus Magasanikbacteria bacterium]